MHFLFCQLQALGFLSRVIELLGCSPLFFLLRRGPRNGRALDDRRKHDFELCCFEATLLNIVPWFPGVRCPTKLAAGRVSGCRRHLLKYFSTFVTKNMQNGCRPPNFLGRRGCVIRNPDCQTPERQPRVENNAILVMRITGRIENASANLFDCGIFLQKIDSKWPAGPGQITGRVAIL